MAALGMIEVFGFTTAVVVADAAAKAGNVTIVALDRNKPANAELCEVPIVLWVKWRARSPGGKRYAGGIEAARCAYLHTS